MANQAAGGSHRSAPVHTHPDDVSLLTALSAVADPVRIQLIRELAGSPDWTRSCGSFDVPVGKAAKSHHFAVLRGAGLVEQRDEGPKRLNRLRREEFDARFPGLLDLVLSGDSAGCTGEDDKAAV
ncbi:ArsR/SmtB family transcription factor [Streptomyces sp. NPDC001843]|uniref:ArsR/SmtB family transcription factor n=1 Tax=Streptomyces sp. NPDC001843 TaxID=3364617 RepID=UPI0036A38165